MSRLGVWLASKLNDIIPPISEHRRLATDKLSVYNYQAREYHEAEKVCPEFGHLWNIEGKNVLDVGSGLGGKPIYYADLGAKSVTAIDLREYSVQSSLKLAHEHRYQNVIRPLVADATRMPFSDNSFDVIVSINVFEHIDGVKKALSECKRVLRPNALMFLYFPPFYSPWGAHVENWIDFPWPHVLFSDKTLIQVSRKVEQKRRNNANYIPTAQVNWEHLDQLPELNRVTVKKFLKMIQELDLRIVEARMQPFGWHYLVHKGKKGQMLLSFLNLISSFPALREILTTKMIFILTKK